MEELGQYLREKTGWALSHSELSRLCGRYFNHETRSVDYARLLDDIRNGVVLKEKSNFLDDSVLTKGKRQWTIDQIIEVLRVRINQRSEYLKGEDKLKKAYLLLSESRSSTVTRQQLKIACQSRLSLFLNDSEVEEIFRHYDSNCEGKINIRHLINAILKKDREATVLSLQIGENGNNITNANTKTNAMRSTNSYNNVMNTTTIRPQSASATMRSTGAAGYSSTVTNNGEEHGSLDDNQNASITYDRQIKGLKAPHPSQCKDYSIQEMEDFIFDRVFERSSLSENMVKTLTRLFSNGENTAGRHIITLDQLKYTLWKRLKLNVTSENVEKFYQKYAPLNSRKDGIDMFHFVDGIIKQRAKNQPILSDQSHHHVASTLVSTSQKKKSIEQFLLILRQQMNDLINRESRAPHYLLYGNTRMTKDQCKQFLSSKLRVSMDQMTRQMVEDIFAEYDLNGLVDTKRMLQEAMLIAEDKLPKSTRDEDQQVGKLAHQTLLNGALVSVDKMPASLTKQTLSPDMIEDLLVSKCMERLKDDHPHASLHRVFRDAGEADSRYITRKGMKQVLHRFDIIMSNEAFETFFNKHDPRREGRIEVHTFLKDILPPVDLNLNPFLPKDQQLKKKENVLAQVVEEMTGKRREVSSLNGPSYTRVEPNFIQELQQANADHNTKPALTLGYNNTVSSATPANTPSRPSTSPHRNYQNQQSTATTTMSHQEQMLLAESLLSAMRDLPLLAQQQSSPTSHSPLMLTQQHVDTPSSSIPPFSPQPPKRPSTAPHHRVVASNNNNNNQVSSVPSSANTNVEQMMNQNNHSNATKQSKARPKSANATYRANSAAQDATQNKGRLTAEDEYRLMQSQHLLAIAEAYAQFTHDQVHGNQGNQSNQQQYQVPSAQFFGQQAKRPSSAPPSRTTNSPFKHMKVPGQETTTSGTFGQSPRFVTPETPRSNASNPAANTSPRQLKFVNTGQHVNVPVSPFESNLQKMYKYTHKNINTTHEEYGLFVKNLTTATKMRQKVTEKQKDQRMTLGQSV